MTIQPIVRPLAVVAACLAVAACSESVTAPVPPAPTGLIAQLVADVYLPTFDSLDVRCARLADALQQLADAPSESTLARAQDAWRDARVPYERNEAFAFGPIETAGFDPRMDTWPVDVAGIDALIGGSTPLTRATIDQLDGTLKGFHAIEYVLFGLGGHTTVDALTPRALEYVAAAGASLAGEA
ncbi:MAG: hypothetical protein IRY91_15905, partial [Gemmatimonadaceae bacterium]|nr:hypothetical protein [Gemmatimonadaceae bacterium]